MVDALIARITDEYRLASERGMMYTGGQIALAGASVYLTDLRSTRRPHKEAN